MITIIIIAYLIGCLLSYLRINALYYNISVFLGPQCKDYNFIVFVVIVSWVGFIAGIFDYYNSAIPQLKFFKL